MVRSSGVELHAARVGRTIARLGQRRARVCATVASNSLRLDDLIDESPLLRALRR